LRINFSRGLPMLRWSAAALALLTPSLAWAADAPKPIDVTVAAGGCEPATITVPPGKSTFHIRNASSQAVEWEILNGVMVVDERENIIPGLSASLTTTLEPGQYQITCGLLSNPKGTLLVEENAAAAPGAPAAASLAPAIAAYKTYVQGEVDTLVTRTRLLVEAVKAGDLAAARAAYAPAHMHYERVEPIAELFNDLDTSMDSRADDFEKKEADPGFSGYHRIEMALFKANTTAGMAPVADKLMADALDLQHRIAPLVVPPKVMVGGAADLIEEVASKKISGEEDRYSRSDLWDFQANVDGAQKIYALLRPRVEAANPALVHDIDANLARVDTLLAKYRTPDGGFQSYDRLTDADRLALRGPITALAEDFAQLRGTLGLA
jgi:iron uptake system component EfeO